MKLLHRLNTETEWNPENSSVIKGIMYYIDRAIWNPRLIFHYFKIVSQVSYFKLINIGHPYHEFYKDLINYQNKYNPMRAVGGREKDHGKLQLKFLKEKGLKPNHKVLDIGCGCLRGGRHIIKYLNKGNYTGTDISEGMLVSARKILVRDDLINKNARLILVKTLTLNELKGDKYDYIQAISVISHMPLREIGVILDNLYKVMKVKSKAYFSFLESKDKNFVTQGVNFFYSKETMVAMAEVSGLKIVYLGLMNTKHQSMLKLKI